MALIQHDHSVLILSCNPFHVLFLLLLYHLKPLCFIYFKKFAFILELILPSCKHSTFYLLCCSSINSLRCWIKTGNLFFLQSTFLFNVALTDSFTLVEKADTGTPKSASSCKGLSIPDIITSHRCSLNQSKTPGMHPGHSFLSSSKN